jgi:hypothetical protein
MSLRRIEKYLYYCDFSNFGDELNKIIFECIFGIKFIYTNNPYRADFFAVGSVLGWFMVSSWKEFLREIFTLFLRGRKLSKVFILGSGFRREYKKFICLRKMDFRIIRGKLTEKVLTDNGILKNKVVYGDLGLLSSFLFQKEKRGKYILGIVPHMNDLNSPIIYDIYKKYSPSSLIIRVNDHPQKVIENIALCENIVSSSLHGLITADAFGIPNLWIENKYKSGIEPHFKYLDYYSIYGITDIHPIQAIDFLNYDINHIRNQYRVDPQKVQQIQKNLYSCCIDFFRDFE